MGKAGLAFLLIAVVFVLHQDFWWWRTPRPLLFGTLPPALSYHAFYCFLASGLMWALIKLCWARELDEMESKPEPPKTKRP